MISVHAQQTADLQSDSLKTESLTAPGIMKDFYTLQADDIERMPVRGIENYLKYLPGVNFQDGLMHVRGGMPYSTAYYLNGINVMSPLDFSNDLYIIPEAVSSLWYDGW